MATKKPSEILRQALKKQAFRNTAPHLRRDNYTNEEIAHGIANNIPWIIGVTKALKDGDEINKNWATETLQKYATQVMV